MKKYYAFIALVVVLSAAALVANVALGAAAVHDNTVSTDLQTISDTIGNYQTQNEPALPAKLSALALDSKLAAKVNAGDYTYSKINYNTYSLCGTYKKATANPKPATEINDYSIDTSNHAAGKQCFKARNTLITQPAAASSSVSITGLPASSYSSTLKVCGTAYNSKVEGVSIKAVDTAKQTITASYNGLDYTISAVAGPPLYSANCAKLGISDMKVGDIVSAYYDAYDTLVASQLTSR